MSLPNYSYSQGDRLAERNTYFYTPAVGAPMVQAWEAARDAALADLPEPASPPQADLSSAVPPTGAVVTADLLEQLMAQLHNAHRPALLDQWLDRLIHKFETTKYVHRAYDEAFRAVDRTKRQDLNLYVRFAEVLAISFEDDGKLPKLNALLKIIDTLCSVRRNLTFEQQQRLSSLILHERKLVASLTDL